MFTFAPIVRTSHTIKSAAIIGGSTNRCMRMMLAAKEHSQRAARVSFHNQHQIYTTTSLSRHSQLASQLDTDVYETHEPNSRHVDTLKASLLFQKAWSNIEQYYGLENIKLPREIFFLMGAPGAGKGTHTSSILHARGIQNQPIGISHLLQSPECRQFMDQGLLISDGHVVELMLHAILQSPHPETGVLVDGFPRTRIQAQVMSLFYEKWTELRSRYGDRYPRPSFRICVLYTDEETSLRRQLARGEQIRKHNRHVKLTGQGVLWQERVTDSDELLIRERYRIFQSNYDSLIQLSTTFPFHWIDASGSTEQVLKSILKELNYQASFELDPQLYDALFHLPTSKKIGFQHQQGRIGRLEYYIETQPSTLQKAIQYIDLHITPHLREHSRPGRLSIPMMQINDARFMDMIMDVLSEKGFQVSVDDHVTIVPTKVDLATGIINHEEHLKHSIVFDFPSQFLRS